MPDFEVYWTAGVRAGAAEPLYRAEDRHYQLKYLPGFAVLAIPIGLLPLEIAKASWFAASIMMIAVFLRLSISILPARRRPVWILMTAGLLAMAKFYGHELVLGQVNLLLGVTIAAAVVLFKKRREAIAGALVALGIVIKPYAVIFLPWLVARRRVPSVLAAAVSLAILLVLPATVYGIDRTISLHAAWWKAVSGSTVPNLLNPDNVSLAAMYAKWFQPGPLAAALAITTGIVLLSIAAVAFNRRTSVDFPDGLEAALLLTMMPLLSPQGWDYVFLVSTPAIIFLINYGDRLPPILRALTIVAVAIIAFSLFDLMGRAAYALFMRMAIISVCFLVVIAALVTLRLRAAA